MPGSELNIIKVVDTCASRVPYDMCRPPPAAKKSTPPIRVCSPHHPRGSLGYVSLSTNHCWAAPAAAGLQIYGGVLEIHAGMIFDLSLYISIILINEVSVLLKSKVRIYLW